MRYSILFPAYNEEETIREAVRETHRVFCAIGEKFEILVIDDGSRDLTAAIVRELQRDIPELRLLQHSTNRGKGAAVKTGAAAARGDALLFLDCDLSVHPRTVLKFLPKLHDAEVLIGSRRVPGAKICVPQSPLRDLAGVCFNTYVRKTFDIASCDTQCGFKMFSRRAADLIFSRLTSSGWIFDVEIFLRARELGLRVIELPVVWQNSRETRVRWRDAWQIWKELRALKRTLS